MGFTVKVKIHSKVNGKAFAGLIGAIRQTKSGSPADPGVPFWIIEGLSSEPCGREALLTTRSCRPPETLRASLGRGSQADASRDSVSRQIKARLL